MSYNLKSQNGFTLLEVLIALTIFSVGLLAIAGLQISAIGHNTNSNLRTSTTALAQGVMEQVLSYDSGNRLLRAAATRPFIIDPNNLDGDDNPATLRLPGGGSFTANWVVTVDDPVPLMSRITVNVQEASGRVISLTSFRRYNL